MNTKKNSLFEINNVPVEFTDVDTGRDVRSWESIIEHRSIFINGQLDICASNRFHMNYYCQNLPLLIYTYVVVVRYMFVRISIHKYSWSWQKNKIKINFDYSVDVVIYWEPLVCGVVRVQMINTCHRCQVQLLHSHLLNDSAEGYIHSVHTLSYIWCI